MRTDVTVNTTDKVHCPKIPAYSFAHRPCMVERGDYVKWSHGEDDTNTFYGRIIGSVLNPDDNLTYLVVAMPLFSGSVRERWVNPLNVFDTSSSTAQLAHMWLHSDSFLDADTTTQRDAMNLEFDSTGKIVKR